VAVVTSRGLRRAGRRSHGEMGHPEVRPTGFHGSAPPQPSPKPKPRQVQARAPITASSRAQSKAQSHMRPLGLIWDTRPYFNSTLDLPGFYKTRGNQLQLVARAIAVTVVTGIGLKLPVFPKPKAMLQFVIRDFQDRPTAPLYDKRACHRRGRRWAP
jgi:hypothetical protein